MKKLQSLFILFIPLTKIFIVTNFKTVFSQFLSIQACLLKSLIFQLFYQ